VQSESALVDNPDIVEDYFRMAEKTLFFAPNLVLKTPICAPAIQVGFFAQVSQFA
jgi:hypothetical protein